MWNLMNKLSKQGKWGQTRIIDGEEDDSQFGEEVERVEELSKKEKGLMDADNRVVIAGEEGNKGTKKVMQNKQFYSDKISLPYNSRTFSQFIVF